MIIAIMAKHKHAEGPGKARRRRAAEPPRPAPSRNRGPRGPKPHDSGDIWIYGTHAAYAALNNPARVCRRILVTRQAAETLAERRHGSATPEPEICSREEIEAALPDGAVHQGIAVSVSPLPDLALDELCDSLTDVEAATLAVLDQASDPRNIGAVMRSAAAFGVQAILVQDRHAPEATAVMAKAASGALEQVPMIRVTNIVRAMETLKSYEFWCIGLDGSADQSLASVAPNGRNALIFGAEGSGLRRLTRETCDMLVKIPISDSIDSLNISNAAAVAFYEIVRNR